LRGVVHAAGVSGTGIVAAPTREDLERVWAPKAAGALRLHAATATRQLDWWVGFSSMASLLGLPGQMAYASANAWLDALAAWRRASGLPATTINWGQWSDVGMSRSLTYSVLDPTSPAEGIEALESLVGGNSGVYPDWWNVMGDVVAPGNADRPPQALFYGDLPAAEADAAAAQLTTQSLRAFETEVTATAWRGRPTTYLITERDAIFPVAPQEALAGRAGSSTVRLPTSHSPFLSQPGAVADIIERAAKQ